MAKQKTIIHNGYCELYNQNINIEIAYIQLPKTEKIDKTEYCKARNKCIDLREKKCTRQNDCPIYKDAANII